jgi:hypothetical protein
MKKYEILIKIIQGLIFGFMIWILDINDWRILIALISVLAMNELEVYCRK